MCQARGLEGQPWARPSWVRPTVLVGRPFVPAHEPLSLFRLTAPKIPEGEKVDFDVSFWNPNNTPSIPHPSPQAPGLRRSSLQQSQLVLPDPRQFCFNSFTDQRKLSSNRHLRPPILLPFIHPFIYSPIQGLTHPSISPLTDRPSTHTCTLPSIPPSLHPSPLFLFHPPSTHLSIHHHPPFCPHSAFHPLAHPSLFLPFITRPRTHPSICLQQTTLLTGFLSAWSMQYIPEDGDRA